jgi:hypothetical protein
MDFFSGNFFHRFASNTFFSAIIAARLWLTRENMRIREERGETLNFDDSINIIRNAPACVSIVSGLFTPKKIPPELKSL